MSDQSDYARAAGVNHPDTHETRRVKTICSGMPREVRWIGLAETIFIIAIVVIGVAVSNGWL